MPKVRGAHGWRATETLFVYVQSLFSEIPLSEEGEITAAT